MYCEEVLELDINATSATERAYEINKVQDHYIKWIVWKLHQIEQET